MLMIGEQILTNLPPKKQGKTMHKAIDSTNNQIENEQDKM